MVTSEPVIIEVKVRRGDRTILHWDLAPGSAFYWRSPNPDCDIITPNGRLTDVQMISTVALSSGNCMRGGYPMFVETDEMGTHPLSLEDRAELESELPW